MKGALDVAYMYIYPFMAPKLYLLCLLCLINYFLIAKVLGLKWRLKNWSLQVYLHRSFLYFTGNPRYCNYSKSRYKKKKQANKHLLISYSDTWRPIFERMGKGKKKPHTLTSSNIIQRNVISSNGLNHTLLRKNKLHLIEIFSLMTSVESVNLQGQHFKELFSFKIQLSVGGT